MPRVLLFLIVIALAAGAVALGFGDGEPPSEAPTGAAGSAEALTAEPNDTEGAPTVVVQEPAPEAGDAEHDGAAAANASLDAGDRRVPLVTETGPVREASAPDEAEAAAPTAGLRLRAVRPGGVAWPELPVELRWSVGGRERMRRGLTDLFGTLELDLPADLEQLEIAWGDGDQAALQRRAFRLSLRPWTTTPLVLEPRLPATLVGRLVDAEGAALAGARVRADHRERPNGLLQLAPGPDEDLAVTDLDGRFEIGGVTGDCHLRFLLPSGAAATSFLSLAAGQRVDQEFRLPAERVLVVRVLDEAGAPLAGAELGAGAHVLSSQPGVTYFDHARSRSDGDGRATFFQAPAAELALGVSRPGYLDWRGRVPPDQEEWQVTLPRAWTVEGLVYRADGEPAAQASVLLWVEEDPARSSLLRPATGSWQAQRTDGRGRFRFRTRVRGERAALLVEAAGHARSVQWPLPIGPENGGLTVTLDRESPLAGRVLAADGSPSRGAEIRVRRVEPDPAWRSAFGPAVPAWSARGFDAERWLPLASDGGFRFDGLPAGLYDLSVRSRDDHRLIAQVRRGSLVEDLVIYEGEGADSLLRFDFQVTNGPLGPPVTDFELVLRAGPSGRRLLQHRVLSSDGRYTWRGLLPGEYAIEVRAPGLQDPGRPPRNYRPGRHFIEVALERPAAD